MIIKQIRAVFLPDGPLASAFGKKGGEGGQSLDDRGCYSWLLLRGVHLGNYPEIRRVYFRSFPDNFRRRKVGQLETIVEFSIKTMMVVTRCGMARLFTIHSATFARSKNR